MVKAVKNTEKRVTVLSQFLDSSVFSDGFHSPEFAKILVNCLKSIELQVKELFVLYQETKHSESKG